jgi:apolipoprotein N-acyltransferase
VVSELGLGEAGVLDGALPLPVAGSTPFARFGGWTLAAALLLAAGVALALSRGARATPVRNF